MYTSPDNGGPGTRQPGPSDQDIESHPLEFTGRGSEYFRVWIVNVLLSVISLGFYTPWARRRTAQYFYGHTLIAHSPLEFTAQQRKMVMGFVLFALLMLAYNIAANTGQDLAVSLFLLMGALLAPYVWGSAMRFRLAATRWRGLRLRFAASWREVYLASWPVFALALVWIGVTFGLDYLSPEAARALEQAGVAPSSEDAKLAMPSITLPMGGLLALGLVLSLLCIIRIEYNYKSLLVQRSYLGTEPGRWKPVYLDFLKVWLGTVGVFLASILVIGILISLLAGGTAALLPVIGKRMGLLAVLWIVLALVVGTFLLMFVSAPARAYREAKMFRLIWNNTGVSQYARFKCRLRASSYVWLRIRNMTLSILTLGLYRPFALVSEYRMKTESVTLHIKGGVGHVAGLLVQQQQQGGLGDAFADAMGLDIIG